MADDNRGLASADEQTRKEVSQMGVEARREESSTSGSKGGQSQGEGRHEFTPEEQSEGGSVSGGNFKNDPKRASEAGSK